MAAINVPCQVGLCVAANLTAAAQLDLFQSGAELGRQDGRRVSWVGDVWQTEALQVRRGNGNGKRGVGLLEVGCKTELDVAVGQTVMDWHNVEVRLPLLGAVFQHLDGFLGLGSGKGRDRRLEDAGLVPCNAVNGVAQHGRVVDAQTRDSAHARVYEDVGGVVFPADTAFNDCNVYAFADVGVQSHESQEAEVDGLGLGGLWVGMAFVSGRCFEPVPRLEKILCKLVL